jgi:hypothetical protein
MALCGIRPPFGSLFLTRGEITHVLLTRSPLTQRVAPLSPFDLHVLGTPPTFTLSQDQTLQLIKELLRVLFKLKSWQIGSIKVAPLFVSKI